MNSRSSTEAELIGVDDKISKILWIKRFLEWQGFDVKLNIYQDNTSTMKIENNGKVSSGKRTRHYDIKKIYVTDLVDRNEVNIEYCRSCGSQTRLCICSCLQAFTKQVCTPVGLGASSVTKTSGTPIASTN